MLLNIQDIQISDKNSPRYRIDFGDILAMSESLKEFGLIQPIVVSKPTEPGGKYLLIAGERRLRAACFIAWTKIECTLKESLPPYERKLLELEENVRRKDINWEEQCEATRQLHELKTKELGKSYEDKEKGWNLDKTAKTLHVSVGKVSQDIKLATQLIEHPELRKRASKMDKVSARKYVNQTLSAKILEKTMLKKGISIDLNLKNISCVEGIRKIPNNSVHLLVTDPPFALDKISKVGDGSSDVGLQYNITQTNVSTESELEKVYEQLIPELFRVMVDGAHFYMFLGMGWYTRLVHLFRMSCFVVDDLPLIWYKERTTTLPRGCHYMSSYEACLFGYKPPQNRGLLKSRPNVISIPAIPPQIRVHPLQKPSELINLFIENSSSPGETVLDCFSGSGATLLCAHKLHRNSLGFELDKDNYYRSLKWFEKEINNVK